MRKNFVKNLLVKFFLKLLLKTSLKAVFGLAKFTANNVNNKDKGCTSLGHLG
jgi:hypothetical protein